MSARALAALAAAALLLSGSTARSVAAQGDVGRLAERCAAAGGATGACMEAAVAARAFQAQVGLLAGLGSEVAGSAGTLGRRVSSSPRIALSARAAFAHLGAPDLASPGAAPSREVTYVVPSLHAGLALGVWDGISLLPTVGGILSLDVLVGASVSFFPEDEGFEGSVGALTWGARLGILRESFTLPGVAVSVTRRMAGTTSFGDVEAGSKAAVEVDPDVTSVRATIGKDILSVGVLGGVGWDRYGGDATLFLPGAQPTSTSDLDASRLLYFGGASLNFLVIQLSTEVGWAQGLNGVEGYRGFPFDPTKGSAFASVAFRLTI